MLELVEYEYIDCIYNWPFQADAGANIGVSTPKAMQNI